MISASIVLFDTDEKDINTVITSYSPNEFRRLIIIDNSATDAMRKYQSCYIEYIHNGKNIGYGSAHNIGIKRAIEMKSDYHVVLNPDIKFETNILTELINYADENLDVVYMLPKVFYPNGEIQYLCKLLPTPFDLIVRRFLPNIGIFEAINKRYTLQETGYNEIMNPPCLSGCFMFLRTSVLAEHELLFDERFFMYFEDFDLIRRLHNVGKTIFYPHVEIIHNHAKQSYKNLDMMYIHIRSAIRYFNKYGWFCDCERTRINRTWRNK